MVKDVTALKRDLRYDHEAEQAVLPVRVHFRDGRIVDTALVLTPEQMHVISIQLERAVVARQDALSKKPR
ncbi:hypothetical protein ABCR94_13975 [Streptomyces sp. 21So2-11]|uniref:hypothetical protein n=1 Tax=Streptomyces sp. 21So2-11 TaxID=3144408 RepID=UPI00321A5FF0